MHEGRVFTGRVVWATACAVAICTLAQAQGISIEHRPVRCIVAERFPVLEARLEPAEAVGRAQVLFRAIGTDDWYFVEMTQEKGLFRGVLPKPLATTETIEYYLQAFDRSLAEARTPDYAPAVVKAGACAASLPQAATLAIAKVVLGCLTPGVGALPSGFSAIGIAAGLASGSAGVAAGAAAGGGEAAGTAAGAVAGGSGISGTAAAAAAAGGAAGGGGLSTAAVVGIVSAGAAAAGVAVAATAGGDSSAGPDITGHWVGSIFDTNPEVCLIEGDLTLDLVQAGNRVSGSADVRWWRLDPDCHRDPEPPVHVPLTGSVTGGVVSFTLTGEGGGSAPLTGTLSGNTMAGTWTTARPEEDGSGTWNVTRQ